MFSKSISGLEITSQAADYAFKNINGDSFGGDCSFLATLRILLHEKAEGVNVDLRYGTNNYSKDTALGSEPDALVRDIVSGYDIRRPGLLLIRNLMSNEETCTAIFKAIDSDSARSNTLNGFVELADVSKFLANNKFRARFFVNEETKSTVIFAERIDFRRWHLLQSLIPRYMPWFFSGTPSVTPEELDFIKTLTSKTADAYEEKICQLTKQFDLRTPMLRMKFKGFEAQADKRALESVRNSLRRNQNDINNLHNRYAELYRQREDYMVRELGLVEKIARAESSQEESEFLKFLLRNKTFNLVDMTDSRIEFIITTHLTNFDPDMAESMIRNHNSYWYEYVNDFFTADRTENFLRAIFMNETLKLKVCAAYSINFVSGDYQGHGGYRYPADITRNHLPNQHIHEYSCLGGNDRIIEQAMMEKDYVGCVAACMSSAANIGFSDTTVGHYWAKRLFDDDLRVIELPDGTCVTPEEAILWLEANGK